jgi:mannose-6-phosphate isomerase-like protein (cupin superfamily)
VVTGHDREGKSVVLFDGAPPATIGNLVELWATESTPANNRGDGEGIMRPSRLAPPDSGSVFRYFRVPPESAAAALDPAAREGMVRARFAAMQAEAALVDTARHPAMHRTRTIDYVIVLSGRVTLLLDAGEVELEPFDAVVQRGTNHAWVNRGEEPALLVAVLVDAEAL